MLFSVSFFPLGICITFVSSLYPSLSSWIQYLAFKTHFLPPPPPPRVYFSFQVLPFDGDPSYSINQHLKKKPQQISFLYKLRLSLKRLFFIATQNMLPLILQFHSTQGHKK